MAEGYYWVRTPDGWEVAKYAVGGWWRCGSEIEMDDADYPDTKILEIGAKVER